VNKKITVSWRKVESLCNKICKKIEDNSIDIDNIIGISRGGLIPATLCAKRLNVRRVYSVGLMSYSDDDDYENRTANPTIYQCEPMSTHFTKNTLIVDDISDKGNTLRFLTTGMLTSPTFFNEDRLFTATLYKKKDTDYHPDYYGDISEDNKWLVFPWEK
jgi:hypoxanthine phosphoribosyltransferase